MKNLGVSIYPTRDSKENILRFLKLCSKYNVKRIFTNLLEVKDDKDVVIEMFKEVNTTAKSYGMEVIIDVDYSLFKVFDIEIDDLKFFKDLCVDGLRLDVGFSGQEEAIMTRNKYGLKIEINASIDTAYVDQIISYDANKSNLITCHNFYPQKYTGLGYEYFERCSKKYKDLGLIVAAFVFSNNKDTFGVWEEMDGLPTLEMHRDFPIDLQVRHLAALPYIDDVIISNCYPSEEELKLINSLDLSKLNIRIDVNNNSDVENEIIYEYPHFIRGDKSDYILRSTMCRIDYKDADIKPNVVRDINVGDVIIVNNNSKRYKGELQIALKPMINDGSKNIVGNIKEQERFLLNYLDSWKQFKLI